MMLSEPFLLKKKKTSLNSPQLSWTLPHLLHLVFITYHFMQTESDVLFMYMIPKICPCTLFCILQFMGNSCEAADSTLQDTSPSPLLKTQMSPPAHPHSPHSPPAPAPHSPPCSPQLSPSGVPPVTFLPHPLLSPVPTLPPCLLTPQPPTPPPVLSPIPHMLPAPI